MLMRLVGQHAPSKPFVNGGTGGTRMEIVHCSEETTEYRSQVKNSMKN